jgi:hypothetical protein
MKIFICGSMRFAKEMLEIKSELEKKGHGVSISPDVNNCLENPELNMNIEHCLSINIQEECFDGIAASDAILVLNYKRNNIEGYVGGATLMEIGVAQHLKKKIFLLYPPPKIEDQRYSVEIQLAKPIILNGDLTKIN